MKVLTTAVADGHSVLERLLARFPDLRSSRIRGWTEELGLLTCLGPADNRMGALLRSRGPPVAGSILSIQDEHGAILPAGEVGEVCARAGTKMPRVLETARRDRPPHSRNGWYHNGDAAGLDDRGYCIWSIA